MPRWVLLSSMTTMRRAGKVSARSRQSCRASSFRSEAVTVFFSRQAKAQQGTAHGLWTHLDITHALPFLAIPHQSCIRFSSDHRSHRGLVTWLDKWLLPPLLGRRNITRRLVAADIA